MEDPYTQVARAVREGRALQAAIKDSANSLADLLDGNLRHVSPYRLKALKA